MGTQRALWLTWSRLWGVACSWCGCALRVAASGGVRLGLVALWVLLVCYPDPRVLWQAIRHATQLPVDAEAARAWAQTLPDDPALIERAVLERVRYAVPWEWAGVPWALPPVGETLALGLGDCQARAVVFASVLAAKGIPFQVRASVDHMWVDYRGRRANALENNAKTLWLRPHPDSRPQISRPQVDWAESWRIEREYFWDPAPPGRRLVLVLGLALLLLWPRSWVWPPGWGRGTRVTEWARGWMGVGFRRRPQPAQILPAWWGLPRA